MVLSFIICWKGAVDSESDISLESCSKAIAAGDGRELWQYLPNGQIASVLGKKCMTLSSGDSVSLMNCDEASADGGSSWEAQGNGMIDLCAPASLKVYQCAFFERSIEHFFGSWEYFLGLKDLRIKVCFLRFCVDFFDGKGS